MKVVYIAGRFRSDTHWGIVRHVRDAEAVALEVWRLGAAALCPHLNTANFEGALPDEVWLLGTIAMLERCDAVMLVPGWETSQGTAAEVKRARALGLPIFVSLADLGEWLAGTGIGSGGDEGAGARVNSAHALAPNEPGGTP